MQSYYINPISTTQLFLLKETMMLNDVDFFQLKHYAAIKAKWITICFKEQFLLTLPTIAMQH